MRSAACVIFRHAVCAGIALSLSACATSGTSPAPPAPVETPVTNETRTTIPAGRFENPPEISPASMNKMLKAKTEPPQSPEPQGGFGTADTRINSKEAQVNVRSAPSAKSAVVTTLKAGQEIKVLETRDTWVRISWVDGVTPRNGWMKKTYIEGY